MHHDAAKRVLFAVMTPEEIARDTDKPLTEVEAFIRRGKEKLLAERSRRETPFIDRTLYTSLNGMFITSYLRAYRVLGDPSLREFALMSLDRILRERLINGALYHADGVVAVLDDHIFLIEALTAAYEATGERRYLDQAAALMDACMKKFGDARGGFFDTETEVLGARLKHIEDVPHPSANAVAAMLLLKLHHITGKDGYRDFAQRTLEAFSGTAAEFGIHAGAYFCALDAYYHMVTLKVEAYPASELARAARAFSGPATTLLYGEDKGRVVPCSGNICHEPVRSPDLLGDFLKQLAG
jgi:uncharacterized protein YyaL (SSP411 family)